MFLRQLYYLLSPTLRLVIRRIFYLPFDLIEGLTGKRDELTPPRGLIFTGYGDFKKTGNTLVRQIIETCNLRPESRVLDIGCGIGRLAIPLTNYLNNKGSYEGFDIVKQGIKWCNNNIKTKYPGFNFVHIDLKNDLYNLKTSDEAKNFVFPYNNTEFDLVIATSVFTHMMPDDVNNYLSQIHRVLKKNGKCFLTFFLLNQDIRKALEKRNNFNFPYHFDNYSLLDKTVKEANVAYEESYLLTNLFPKNSMKVENTFYGWWSGKSRENSMSFQDIIILSKKV